MKSDMKTGLLLYIRFEFTGIVAALRGFNYCRVLN